MSSSTATPRSPSALGPVLDALRTLGVDVDGDARALRGARPRRGPRGGEVVDRRVRRRVSSSARSCSSAPRFDDGLTCVHDGPPCRRSHTST